MRQRFLHLLLIVIVGILCGHSSLYAYMVPPSDGPIHIRADLPICRFVVGGHWYGAHENYRSVYPAASLWANLPEIQRRQPNLLISLGDAVRNANDENAIAGLEAFEKQAGIPIKWVAGNHDFDASAQGNGKFGSYFDTLRIGGNLLLFLNTEWISKGGCKASSDFIEGLSPQGFENIFVFSHHLLWALSEPGFQKMDDFANAPYAAQINPDSANYLYDAVLALSKGRALHWFSGDVGTPWSFPIFSDHAENRNFYAAGLSDGKDDAAFYVEIYSNGRVNVEILPLGPKKWQASYLYDLEFWKGRVPERRKQFELSFADQATLGLQSKKFWLGILIGAVVASLLGWLFRFRRKRKAG